MHDQVKNSLSSQFRDCSGRLALSECPGKNFGVGRNGVCYKRSLKEDLKYLKESHKVEVIVCLLNMYELRHLGVQMKDYEIFASDNGIQLLFYPIIEMAIPS